MAHVALMPYKQVGRNTAPAIALAALTAKDDPLLLIPLAQTASWLGRLQAQLRICVRVAGDFLDLRWRKNS